MQIKVNDVPMAEPYLDPGRLLKPGTPDGLTHSTIIAELLKCRLGSKELARRRWLLGLLPGSRQGYL